MEPKLDLQCKSKGFLLEKIMYWNEMIVVICCIVIKGNSWSSTKQDTVVCLDNLILAVSAVKLGTYKLAFVVLLARERYRDVLYFVLT